MAYRKKTLTEVIIGFWALQSKDVISPDGSLNIGD